MEGAGFVQIMTDPGGAKTHGSGSTILLETKPMLESGLRIRIDLMRIQIRIRIQHIFQLRIRIPDPDPGFDDLKIAIYLSLGLHKGGPSYRRSLQPSKENIQHFKT
jgi:hypothetical protein